jgi:hypothetical protein
MEKTIRGDITNQPILSKAMPYMIITDISEKEYAERMAGLAKVHDGACTGRVLVV